MCFYHDVNGEEYGKETKICVNIWRIQLLFASLHRGRNSFIFWRALEPEVLLTTSRSLRATEPK